MRCISKVFLLLLVVILAVSSLIMFESAFAQTPTPSPIPIPKPSVPEFNLELIISPPESHFINKTIELSIKNQPSVLAYNVRMRVNDDNWRVLYPNNNSVPTQSEGEYTILSYSSGYLGVENQYNLGYTSQNLPAGDKVDFQVQAMVGSIHRVFNPNFTNQLDMYPYVFTGETSDWSNIRTITIPSSELSPTPSVPEFSLWTLPLLLSIMAATSGLLVYGKKRKRRVE